MLRKMGAIRFQEVTSMKNKKGFSFTVGFLTLFSISSTYILTLVFTTPEDLTLLSHMLHGASAHQFHSYLTRRELFLPLAAAMIMALSPVIGLGIFTLSRIKEKEWKIPLLFLLYIIIISSAATARFFHVI
jgi:hypothetical protein